MESVTVNRVALLRTIRANRDQHRTIFHRAQTAYRSRLIQELDRKLADARAGRVVAVAVALPVPEDHTPDYDRVIKMIEMSVSENILLSELDFSEYVMDDWAWKRGWTTTTASYVPAVADPPAPVYIPPAAYQGAPSRSGAAPIKESWAGQGQGGEDPNQMEFPYASEG